MFFFVKIAFALLSFKRKAVQFCCLPPHGGSGLKYFEWEPEGRPTTSPSTRREWIEIAASHLSAMIHHSLPPHGGSGLKSVILACKLRVAGLPPHGGSGLKYVHSLCRSGVVKSPSTRREWIEIFCNPRTSQGQFVSLHTEGVD